MNRWFLSAAMAASLSGLAMPASADAPTPFTDAACPQANDPGRKLNDLNAKGDVNGDDLMAAAQALADAYKDCEQSFDRTQNMKNGDHQSDYIPVNRMYSRLQLAKSYQRIASFYEQLHQPDKARANYEMALPPLGEIATIMSGTVTGLVDQSSPEYRLQQQAATLHDQIVASEAKLPPAAASPAASQR